MREEPLRLTLVAIPEQVPDGIAQAVVRTARGGEYRASVGFGAGARPADIRSRASGRPVAGDPQTGGIQLADPTVPPLRGTGTSVDLPAADLTILAAPERPEAGEEFSLSVFILANRPLSHAEVRVELSPNLTE
ncbi:MAG TPA: hypothetical protein VMY98_10305, partial [Anaerolineae bacterium]|nr:hypothetical protein [Anaerolineae bacterium]